MLGFLAWRTARGRRYRWGFRHVLLAWLVLGAIVVYWQVSVPLLVIGGVLAILGARHRRTSRRLSDLSLAEWLDMDPERFEHAVVELLRDLGWHDVRWTGGNGDRGADAIGIDTEGRRTVVQCKRFGPRALVGSPVVQMALGSLVAHNADRAMIVTTSGFTAHARHLAGEMDVVLVGGSDLIRLARLVKVAQGDA